MFRVVVPAHNCEQWIGTCLRSIQSQKEAGFRCIVIEDASSDTTLDVARGTIQGDSRFVVYTNAQRRGALCNIVRAIETHACDDDDVITVIDGDDWLPDTDVFSILRAVYQEPRVIMTYGQLQVLSSGQPYPSQGYPPEVFQSKSFRQIDWRGTHLRTFRHKLWAQIRPADLIDPQTGKHWETAWDMAMMFPMLEMCSAESARFMARTMYVYNDLNPLNDFRIKTMKQREDDRRIRAMVTYRTLFP